MKLINELEARIKMNLDNHEIINLLIVQRGNILKENESFSSFKF